MQPTPPCADLIRRVYRAGSDYAQAADRARRTHGARSDAAHYSAQAQAMRVLVQRLQEAQQTILDAHEILDAASEDLGTIRTPSATPIHNLTHPAQRRAV